MKIAIFGGSFNPVHQGHISIAKEAVEKLNLDKLYFVPAYKNPFKSKHKYVDVEHRIAMLKRVLFNKTDISLFEANRKGISYTIDTVLYFRKQFPDAELYLILGSDNLPKLNKWKNIETISQETKIIIFKRSNNIVKTNIKKFNCYLLNNEIYDFSSTEFQQGKLDVVPIEVRKYIGENFLYLEEILKNSVDAKRFKHCLATASAAAEYAKVLKYDAKIAWIAGLVHDITKTIPNDAQRQYLESHKIDASQYRDYQLHQTTAAVWLEKDYYINNKDIVEAVKWHTSLNSEMTVLGKIVFVADKLAQGRRYPGIQKVRQLALTDFNEAFKIVVQQTWDFNKAKNIEITSEQETLYKKWTS
ncbi:nicotinate-nucleotide adenylyltransferase [Mycoplasma iguanae]|uniref:Probable nicotinate-nucleotide adenylyltransferase n=1 Tax=Mycoplasma iguanae TaxID=292461 RepID=A0ABY5R8Q1_9MOLU|nr:nicotinate-nucleotide adenylyltransferase [Mycoplasma iguanae]UVD81878.1 nicotinate-nucleotide adenylyltransferase [Mycoplasma iguanae]